MGIAYNVIFRLAEIKTDGINTGHPAWLFSLYTRSELSFESVSPLLESTYKAVIGSLAFRAIVRNDKKNICFQKYDALFRLFFEKLEPGGYLVFGDNVGIVGLYEQLSLLKEIGFINIDCVWREEDFFVA